MPGANPIRAKILLVGGNLREQLSASGLTEYVTGIQEVKQY